MSGNRGCDQPDDQPDDQARRPGMWRRARGYSPVVEPIPETLEALVEVDAHLDEDSLREQLTSTATRAERLVPGVVGVSVAFREQGLTFTLVATPDGLLAEDRWQEFARASAAAGVQSTLTLPVVAGDVVVSTVNLYGRETDTFAGRHEELADLFGAWAPGAIANADLSFATRRAAQQAPTQLREAAVVETAVGILAWHRNVTVEVASAQLHESARRAGVPVLQLARLLVQIHEDQ